MKKALRTLALALAIAAPGLASAQSKSADCKLIAQSDVLRTYRRVKLDMEEKARNVKGMKDASPADVQAFEEEYASLRKEFNQFIAGFRNEVMLADGKPLNLCELSRAQIDDMMRLYQNYETHFLYRYEAIVNVHERPLIESNFKDKVLACNPRTAVVSPSTYRNQYEPELTVATWGRL